MFGVTTSDDYRPVAWMGRYPVDVTTMLVGVHVAAAILAAHSGCIPGLVGTLNYFGCNSTVPRSGPAARCGGCLPMPSFMSRHHCFGLPSRCTCCLYSGEKWNVFSVDAPTSRSTYFVAHTGSATDDLGTVGTFRNCRFARVTLWNICCVCHDLSARRNVAADPRRSGSR